MTNGVGQICKGFGDLPGLCCDVHNSQISVLPSCEIFLIET